MNKIPVLYSFARSGGTIINKLLGVHPRCLVLSEVNPAASCKSVAEQAVEWLGLLQPDEENMFSRNSYSNQIKILYERAMRIGKQLIVRDWVTANFLPGCVVDLINPSGQLEQALYLKHAGFEPVPLVISRRGIAVYESIRQNFTRLRNIELAVFARSYLDFARAVSNFPVIHLEDLRAHPDVTLLKVLKNFDLDSDICSRLLQTFPQYDKCTGNIGPSILSGSSRALTILPPDAGGSQDYATRNAHPSLHEADRVLGYE